MEAVDTAVEPDDLIAAFFDKERTSAVIAEAEATSIPMAVPMDVAPAGASAYLDTADHRAGFVSIVGKPNVGKSTLMNAILGTRLSIITSKAQTTRHRIMGIMNGDDYQIVYSDTPGVLIPQYKLQEGMMRFVQGSINDADVIVVVVDIFQDSSFDEKLLRQLRSSTAALLVLLNKVDLMPAEEAAEDEDEDGAAEDGSGAKRSRRVTTNALGSQDELVARWEAEFDATVLPISARYGEGLDAVLERIKALLPVHPPFYPKDQLSDKPEKFFAAEMMREAIFGHYSQEIPYSCEVAVTSFKEGDEMIKISCEIYCAADSQKGIIIGKGGKALKAVGTKARGRMEAFFGKKVFLETRVKVSKSWRNDESALADFGYL